MKTITRKMAVEQGLYKYYSGIPCKRGHVDLRITKTYACMACLREYANAHRQREISGRANLMRRLRRLLGNGDATAYEALNRLATALEQAREFETK